MKKCKKEIIVILSLAVMLCFVPSMAFAVDITNTVANQFPTADVTILDDQTIMIGTDDTDSPINQWTGGQYVSGIPFHGGCTFSAIDYGNDAWDDWEADFVVTFNKPLVSKKYNIGTYTFDSIPILPVGMFGGEANGWWQDLKGVWLPDPITSYETAGSEVRLVKQITSAGVTYKELCENIKDFSTGFVMVDDIADPSAKTQWPDGLTATVELRLYDPEHPADYIVVDELDFPHVHTVDYNTPTVIWRNINGVYSAILNYDCPCGETVTEIVKPEISDHEGVRTYTATNSHTGAQYTNTKTLEYKVWLNGNLQPTTYSWGDVCTLTDGTTPKAWYLDAVGDGNKIGDGTATFMMPVTKDTHIVTGETAETKQTAAISASIEAAGAGKAVFQTKWSVPKGCTVNAVNIYRGYTSQDKTVNEETLISKGSQYNVKLLALNGDYKLEITGLSSGKYQHALIQIKYTDEDGAVQTLTSKVQKVLVS